MQKTFKKFAPALLSADDICQVYFFSVYNYVNSPRDKVMNI